jgi:hypothetical protein
MVCHACGSDIKFVGKISRTEDCPDCGADIHCCLNCDNHDRSAHNQCREPQAEWVTDREKANFCDYFTPNTRKDAKSKKASRDAARSAFDNLFKK